MSGGADSSVFFVSAQWCTLYQTEVADPVFAASVLSYGKISGEAEKSEKGGMRKDADFTGKIKSAVAGGGRNRYNKDSVFLSLDIEETTGGQYADNRNQRNMDSTLCKIIIG